MTCAEFDDLLVDLGREPSGAGGMAASVPLDEDTRHHADSCPRCAARLAEETALSAALRAVSVKAAGLEAPPRVESAVLRAFRETRRTNVVSAARDVGGRGRPRWTVWAGLAAAAAIAVAAVDVARDWQVDREALQQSATDVSASAGPAQGRLPEVPPLGAQARRADPAGTGEAVTPAERAGAVARLAASPTSGRANAKRSDPVRSGTARVQAAAAEAALGSWSFLGLAADDAGSPEPVLASVAEIDTAPMVRVMVSRAALAALGVLDADTEDPATVVEVDVIVGGDGLARAIRIVSAADSGVRPSPLKE